MPNCASETLGHGGASQTDLNSVAEAGVGCWICTAETQSAKGGLAEMATEPCAQGSALADPQNTSARTARTPPNHPARNSLPSALTAPLRAFA